MQTTKQILHIDMDGVIVNFNEGVYKLNPQLDESIHLSDSTRWDEAVDRTIESNLDFFLDLPPMHGAIEAIRLLSEHYEIYFLSTPTWSFPHSFSGKRIWIEKHFGDFGKKKLILTHRKDLVIGDFLIDDRLKNGAENFKGVHIHFGADKFPDWKSVTAFLI